MSRLTTLLVLAALSILPMGCVFLDAPPQMPLAGYPFHHNRSDFKIAWKTIPSQRDVAVEVTLKNVRYPWVSNLRLDLSLKQGDKVIAQNSAPLFGGLRDGDYGKVTVQLRDVALSPDDQFRFRIRYNSTEGSTTRTRVTEFTVDAVTGAVYENESSPE